MPQVGLLAAYDLFLIPTSITPHQILICFPREDVSTLAPSAEDCAMQGITGPSVF